MKRRILLLTVLAITLFTSCLSQNRKKLEEQTFKLLVSKSDKLLEECITFNETAGISSGIYKSNKIVWKGAAGFMDLENKIKANPEMLNRSASIAKPMTSIAILQLYEQKKLNLDDPIQKHLSYFPKKKEGEITIRHLLNHTSGVDAYNSQEEAFPTKNYTTLREAISVFKDRPLRHAPGLSYSYTTYGYVILGAIIEKVSGMTFRDYMKQNIWEKAGMSHTDVELFDKQYNNKSKLYYKNRAREIVLDIVTNLSVKVPGGGFYTTTEDLLKFGEAVINNKLIQPETFKLMITDPKIKTWGTPYAMGWFIYGNNETTTGRIIGHSGSQSGASTQMLIYLDKKVIVATLSNTSGVWNEIFDVTNKLASNAVFPENIKKPLPKVISISETLQENYVGTYQGENNRIRNITRTDGQLFIELNNNVVFQLHATSNNVFFLRGGNIVIELIKEEKEGDYKLIITDNGEGYHYRKVLEK